MENYYFSLIFLSILFELDYILDVVKQVLYDLGSSSRLCIKFTLTQYFSLDGPKVLPCFIPVFCVFFDKNLS